jgi:hypothetical protein
MTKERFDHDQTKSIEPTIKLVRRDVLLLGTAHDAQVPWDHPFFDYIEEADHLLIEFNIREGQGLIDALQNTSTFIVEEVGNYELLAMKYFLTQHKPENIHFLEGDTDLFTLAKKYGVPLSTTLHYFMSKLESIVHEQTEVVDRVSKYKANYPTLADVEDIILVDHLGRARAFADRSMRDSHKILRWRDREIKREMKGFEVFGRYMGTVRDYETLGPNAVALADNLPGKKVIMVGKDHIPAIEGVLRGSYPSQPRLWYEYISALDQKSQSAVAYFEKMSRGEIVI